MFGKKFTTNNITFSVLKYLQYSQKIRTPTDFLLFYTPLPENVLSLGFID